MEAAIEIVEAGGDLSMEQMAAAMGQIMDGGCHETQIARLLAALHRKGETVAEVAGAAAAMRQRMTPIRSARARSDRHLRHRRRRLEDVQHLHGRRPGRGGGRRAGGQARQPRHHQP